MLLDLRAAHARTHAWLTHLCPLPLAAAAAAAASLLPSPRAQISFGIFRVYAVEAGIKQPKFFFFKWAGSAAPLKRKVASNTVKTSVQAYFSVRGSGRRGRHGAARRGAHVPFERRCATPRSPSRPPCMPPAFAHFSRPHFPHSSCPQPTLPQPAARARPGRV